MPRASQARCSGVAGYRVEQGQCGQGALGQAGGDRHARPARADQQHAASGGGRTQVVERLDQANAIEQAAVERAVLLPAHGVDGPGAGVTMDEHGCGQ